MSHTFLVAGAPNEEDVTNRATIPTPPGVRMCPPYLPITHPQVSHSSPALLGNVTTLDRLVPARSWLLLWKQYGEIYQLNLLGSF